MVTEEAQQMLRNATELDYLTHIIIRMYENKRYAVNSLVAVFPPLTYIRGAGILKVQLHKGSLSPHPFPPQLQLW